MKKLVIIILFSLFLCQLSWANQTTGSMSIDQGAVTSAEKPSSHFHRFFVRVEVPSLFTGWLDGAADVAVTRSFALGVMGTYYALNRYKSGIVTRLLFGGDSTTSEGLGLEAVYALSKNLNTDGWLINPYVEMYRSTTVGSTAKSSFETVTHAGLNLDYQWYWPVGIFVRFGLGGYYSTDKSVPGVALSNFHPSMDLNLGFSF